MSFAALDQLVEACASVLSMVVIPGPLEEAHVWGSQTHPRGCLWTKIFEFFWCNPLAHKFFSKCDVKHQNKSLTEFICIPNHGHSHLYVFSVQFSGLEEVPLRVFQIVDLVDLSLAGNKISSLPDDIKNLVNVCFFSTSFETINPNYKPIRWYSWKWILAVVWTTSFLLPCIISLCFAPQ